MNLDEYQIQHAKNFRYRYYPPRLVELEKENAHRHHAGEYVYDSNYPDGGGTDGSVSEASHTHVMPTDNYYSKASSNAGATFIKWAIILLVLLLVLFLILGLMSMYQSGSSNSSNNGVKSGGGSGKRR
jgi:hypothetical protein